jgi:uncharacterized membrane protein
MNWITFMIAFAVGGAVAAPVTGMLKRKRSGWGRARRSLCAAALVPLAIFAVAIAAIAWTQATGPAQGEHNRDPTSLVIIVFAAVVAICTLIGGLVGAALAERQER